MADVPLNFTLIFESQGKNRTDEDTINLMANIEYFRKLSGWSRKRIYLMGAATMVGNDNPQLVLQIAEYLAGAKPKQREVTYDGIQPGEGDSSQTDAPTVA